MRPIQIRKERKDRNDQSIFSRYTLGFKEPTNLPIEEHQIEILEKIRRNTVTILSGPTGCGMLRRFLFKSNNSIGFRLFIECVRIQVKLRRCRNIFLTSIVFVTSTVTLLLHSLGELQQLIMQNEFVLSVTGNWERLSAIK